MAFWTSSVSPIPAFPAYSGPYAAGTVDVEIPSSELLPSFPPLDSKSDLPPTIAFRCFYPCQRPDEASRPVLWVPQPQKEVLHAFYSEFLQASPALSTFFQWMSRILLYTTIPALRNAPLLPAPHPSARWPVLVFSHGLAGSRNSYSHICGSLASHGIIVLAPDHRDGSSPLQFIRKTACAEARSVPYRTLPHTSTPDVYEARDDQLRIRLAELSMLFEALLKIDRGDNVSNLDPNDNSPRKSKEGTKSPPNALLSMFRNSMEIHDPGKITWAGHSFGGATIVQFLKSVFYYSFDSASPLLRFEPSAELKAQVTSSSPAMLLDPWALPFKSPFTATLASKPLPCFAPDGPGGDSILTVMSQHFFNWRENLLSIKTVIRDPAGVTSPRPQARIFYPLRSAHLSQSDYGILFPNLAKFLAKAVEPERTLRLNVRAVLEVMRRAGLSVADTSTEDMELDKITANVHPDSPEQAGGDWRILSCQEGAVRGWVASEADADEAVEAAKVEEREDEVLDEKAVERGNAKNRDHVGQPSNNEDSHGQKESKQQQARKRVKWWLLRRASAKQEAELLGRPDVELGGALTSAAAEEIRA